MSLNLTKGRTEIACKNNIGGVKRVYFFKYVYYTYDLIQGKRGAEITSFPASDVYLWEVTNGVFNETINNDEQGVSYEQVLSFDLKKQDLLTANELDLMTKIDLRYVVEFNDGSLKVGGVYNGASLEYNNESGGAKSDFNGYRLTLRGSEVWQSPYIDSISIITGEFNYVFEDSINFIFEDNNNFIFN